MLFFFVIGFFTDQSNSGSTSSTNSVEFKAKIDTTQKDGNTLRLFKIKGAPAIGFTREIKVIIKLTDKETGLPVISNFENFREAHSTIFESETSLGKFKLGSYWPDWVGVGGFMDEMIIGPHKGNRTLKCMMVVCAQNEAPIFNLGNLESTSSVIDFTFCDIVYNFINSGYKEIDNERLRTQEIAVELAIGISMSDGEFDDKEGFTIQGWIKKIVENSNDNQKNDIKKSLNNALERGFENFNANKFDMNTLCKEVKKISSTVEKYNLIELCLDVMAADGVADVNELKIIREISQKIDIDYDEMTKLKDRRLVNLDPVIKTSNLGLDEKNLEESLGIKPTWDIERKKKYILNEFSKWNGRMSSLKEGKEKINAQNKLALLAELRKKYD